MTDTNTDQAEPPINPSDILQSLLVTLLAPMFFALCAGDIAIARMAALETINGYRARSHVDLILIAQIIGFGLAALGSLSLSMADDISVSLTLRLRGNANACNRSAEQNRRALASSQDGNPLPKRAAEPADPEISAELDLPPDRDVFLSASAEQQLAAESQARLQPTTREISVLPPAPAARPSVEKQNQEIWATAMTKEANEIAASIPNLPPAEQDLAAIQVSALTAAAHELLHGTPSTFLKPGALTHMTRPNTGPAQFRR
jgi:hypothetical protein